jgi:hypothetical protein
MVLWKGSVVVAMVFHSTYTDFEAAMGKFFSLRAPPARKTGAISLAARLP